MLSFKGAFLTYLRHFSYFCKFALAKIYNLEYLSKRRAFLSETFQISKMEILPTSAIRLCTKTRPKLQTLTAITNAIVDTQR